MAITMHQTKQDIANQEVVIGWYCRKYGYTYDRLNDNYLVDYAVYDKSGVVALVEVKCHRKYPFNKYNGTMCSVKKRAHTVQYASSIGCDALMLSRFPCGQLRLTDLRHPHTSCRMIHAQRRDKYDSELHFFWHGDASKLLIDCNL